MRGTLSKGREAVSLIESAKDNSLGVTDICDICEAITGFASELSDLLVRECKSSTLVLELRLDCSAASNSDTLRRSSNSLFFANNGVSAPSASWLNESPCSCGRSASDALAGVCGWLLGNEGDSTNKWKGDEACCERSRLWLGVDEMWLGPVTDSRLWLESVSVRLLAAVSFMDKSTKSLGRGAGERSEGFSLFTWSEEVDDSEVRSDELRMKRRTKMACQLSCLATDLGTA